MPSFPGLQTQFVQARGEFHSHNVFWFRQVYHTFQGLYLPLLHWWHRTVPSFQDFHQKYHFLTGWLFLMKGALHFVTKLNFRDTQKCSCFWVASYDLFGKQLRNYGPQRPETWTNCLYIKSFITLHFLSFLSFFHRRVSNLILCCVTVKTIYTQYTHLVAQVSSTQHYIIELISTAPNEDFTNTLKALFRLHRELLDSYWYIL